MARITTVGVTGAAGFIGSSLSKELVNRGYYVIGIDNLSKGDKKRLNNIGKRFNFVNCDLLDTKKTSQALSSTNVIVHLAAGKIPRYGSRLETITINTIATDNVLRAAVKRKKKVIFASTSDVYGKSNKYPFQEDSDLVLGSPEVARWAYSASKILNEQMLFAYWEKYKIPFVILRLFGVYGPNQHTSWWGGPQALFIEKILAGNQVEIHGSGKQTRSFVYIDDVVEAIIKSIEKKSALGQVINVGTTDEISMISFANLIAKIAGRKLKIKKVPYNSFTGKKYEDIERKVPALTKAKKYLSWTPTTSLESGIKRTIDWLK